MGEASATTAGTRGTSFVVPPELPRRSAPAMPVGYLAAVTPALESALASAHEAGHERAVRILHAVLSILDDPGLR